MTTCFSLDDDITMLTKDELEFGYQVRQTVLAQNRKQLIQRFGDNFRTESSVSPLEPTFGRIPRPG